MHKTAIFFAILTISIPCAAGTITVNWDGSGDYTTIQAGINAAVSGADTVEVTVGTYYENINFNGKNIVLTSTDPADSNVVRDTIIDGNNSGSVVTFSGTETSACELTGFTITNGYTTGRGGGIKGSETDATISNCVITGNSAHGRYHGGGGLYDCDGTIINCVITDNYASKGRGGGLQLCGGDIIDCIITGNESFSVYDPCAVYAGGTGGGLSESGNTITNCTIADNHADMDGGGLASCGSMTNCTISNNTADSRGGGLFSGGYLSSITNCTITGNSSLSYGDGIAHWDGEITNCIIWGNTGSQVVNSSTPTHSCIQDWAGGGLGNITSEPNFADVSNDDYHLMSQAGRWDPNQIIWVTDVVTSPCIDAGNPGCPIGDESNDIANVRINMGAYGGTTEASRTPAGWGLLCDVNNDFSVNTGDLVWLARYYYSSGECIPADFSRDQTVNIFDFVHLYIEWLTAR